MCTGFLWVLLFAPPVQQGKKVNSLIGACWLIWDQLNAGNKSHLGDMVLVICFNIGVGSSCVLLPLHTSPLTFVPTGMFPSCVSVFRICSLWFSGLFYTNVGFLSFLSPVCVACPFVNWNIDLDLGHQHYRSIYVPLPGWLCSLPDISWDVVKLLKWLRIQCYFKDSKNFFVKKGPVFYIRVITCLQ